MPEEPIDRATEELAPIARIPSLWDGVVAFELDGLRDGKWYELEDWHAHDDLGRVPVTGPVEREGEDAHLDLCRLEVRNGLERRRLEIADMARAVPESPQPRSLLAQVERCLAAA